MNTEKPDVRPLWEERVTPHFTFVFNPQSNSSQIPVELGELADLAEEVYATGSEFLGLEKALPRISIYLGDASTQTLPPANATIVIPLDQNHLRPTLTLAILEKLFHFSPYYASPFSDKLLHTLAFTINHRHESGTKTDQIDAANLSQLTSYETPPDLFEPHTADHQVEAETSFLNFLETSHGRKKLLRFIRTCFMADPELASRLVYAKSFQHLKERWFASLKEAIRKSTRLMFMLRLSVPLLKPHSFKVVELMAYMGLDLLFGLAVPISAKFLYDNVIAVGSYRALGVWAVIFISIFLVGSLASYRRLIVGELIGDLVLCELRRSIFAHLQALPLRFYARVSTGDVLSRITNDADRVQAAIGQNLPDFVFQIISISVFSAALLILNWRLGLIVLLVGVPTYALVYIRQTEKLRKAEREDMERIGELTSFTQENLSSQLVIKTFSLATRARAAFEIHLQNLFKSGSRVTRLQGKMFGWAGLISLGLRVSVMTSGAVLVMRGTLTVGDLIAFVALITQALNQIVAITTRYQRLQSATGAFGRLQELMKEQTEETGTLPGINLPRLQSDIKVDHVTFNYSDSTAPVLRDATLSIKAGSQVAIVGPSGSGKSTLIGLLLRLHQPTRGRVLFDDIDIRQVNLTSLRSQLAVIPQDTFLFNASILENIALGREGSDEADVKAAAKAAMVHDFAEGMESGYQTVIGERGTRLSGGQRQRLAIARALIRDPTVLILDEATSALDPKTEANILKTIQSVAHGRTLIFITHRLASAVKCDNIFVLNQGRIVEEGNHDQLVSGGGLYQQLYEEQTRHLTASALTAIVEGMRLRAIPLFADLGHDTLIMVAEYLVSERFLPGEIVVQQGEPGDRLYFIGAGQVDVFEDGRWIRTMNDGDYFGEIALLTSGIRTATVRAVTATQLYSLSKKNFMVLLDREPRIREAVERRLAEQYSVLL